MNSYKSTTPILLALLIIGGLYGCNQISKNGSTVELPAVEQVINDILPPLEDVDVAFSSFKLNASEEQTIKLNNGTKIKVPKDAFRDASGGVIDGEVELQFREFHRGSDILASGIPMTISDGNGTADLQSAGMFEIKGMADGNEVLLADGKNIEVELASFAEGSDYNFYRLDETGNWDELAAAVAPEENTAKEELLALLDNSVPEKPYIPPLSPDERFVFDMDINFSKFPELKSFHNVVWQFGSNNIPEDPSKYEHIFSKNWANIEIEKLANAANTYDLVLSQGDEVFRTRVQPALACNKSDYDAQLKVFSQKMDRYEDDVQQWKAERKRTTQEADLLRSFTVSSFGIYNWDRKLDESNQIFVDATFDIGGINTEISSVTIFLVTGEDRSVVKYPPSQWDNFRFDPNLDNKLIAILPGNKIATFSSSQFKNMNLSELRNSKLAKYTFEMQMEDQVIASVDDLDAVLKSI